MATNPWDELGGIRGGWNVANDGIDLLRFAVVGSLVTSILFKIIPGGGLVLAVLQLIASVIFGFVVIAALAKWRQLPPETRAVGLANLAWLGAIINLVGTGISIVVTFMALGGSLRSIRKLEDWLVLVVVVTALGSILQIVGFLLSARTVALHLERPDIAARATTTLVLGALTVGVSILAAVGGMKSAGVGLLLALLGLAIGGLVTFLMTLSGIQRAIRDRPDPSEAFS